MAGKYLVGLRKGIGMKLTDLNNRERYGKAAELLFSSRTALVDLPREVIVEALRRIKVKEEKKTRTGHPNGAKKQRDAYAFLDDQLQAAPPDLDPVPIFITAPIANAIGGCPGDWKPEGVTWGTMLDEGRKRLHPELVKIRADIKPDVPTHQRPSPKPGLEERRLKKMDAKMQSLSLDSLVAELADQLRKARYVPDQKYASKLVKDAFFKMHRYVDDPEAQAYLIRCQAALEIPRVTELERLMKQAPRPGTVHQPLPST